MAVAKVHHADGRQFLGLPDDLRLHGDEVDIERRGDEVVIRERRAAPGDVRSILGGFSLDYSTGDRVHPLRPSTKVIP
jgi:virulence-associated protein VagC